MLFNYAVNQATGLPIGIPNRGNGGRGGGADHANIQKSINDIAGGSQEVALPVGANGNYRIMDNIDDD